MTLKHKAASLLKQLILGSANLPQQCPVEMHEPQSEIEVTLRGCGAARDVTHCHFMASGAPLTIGIGYSAELGAEKLKRSRPSLAFSERQGGRKLLGQIGLRYSRSISMNDRFLHLFGVESCSNHCLATPRLWARYLEYAYLRRRTPDPDVPITACEVHSMIVFYICPRPVVLVSACDGSVGNLFPMNLMGAIGTDHFCFALNSSRAAAPLVARCGQIAISSVPAENTTLAFSLGKNHRKTAIDWTQLPFAKTSSPAFGLPIPCFASRVREVQVEATEQVGSHTLFLSRVISDEHRSEGPQFFMVHGIYQAWRLKHLSQLAA